MSQSSFFVVYCNRTEPWRAPWASRGKRAAPVGRVVSTRCVLLLGTLAHLQNPGVYNGQSLWGRWKPFVNLYRPSWRSCPSWITWTHRDFGLALNKNKKILNLSKDFAGETFCLFFQESVRRPTCFWNTLSVNTTLQNPSTSEPQSHCCCCCCFSSSACWWCVVHRMHFKHISLPWILLFFSFFFCLPWSKAGLHQLKSNN